ncbi:double zinc ribbon domain-containing protein [Paenibacillus rhizophilus]|uniref:RanBP2-type domain-containing protein n=1 Tax=Paenibacillus rhizophilus TaxID=1850366 RepID=A0A3N9NYW5_9BACL|nr:zinc ribbon domain-containing protein [Paenibacillus rhizophilus]RQW08835.1 hypothetical protein EH198_20805 [Paenibacillus rhizophilus]
MTLNNNFFDFTPDPKVLIALTHTPMMPLDALCEIVDNAIDSFTAAKLMGIKIESPLISVELPKLSELNKDTGKIRVRDNGPGLSAEMAERAIKAGFSGNNPYDSLGLFGMGFNISTGKLGRSTRLLTARKDDSSAIDVVINLDHINLTKSYQLPFNRVDKPKELQSGTVIEIDQWWPEGNANSHFVKRLVQYGAATVRSELGRRYASILRKREIRLLINGEPCEPFEHCVWGPSRFVERRIHGRIPARFDFDQTIGTQRRCANCTALVSMENLECPSCGSSNIRSIEERIKGWVGIQRFDSNTEYGVDLIRNGRSIRIAEKSAFFEFTDEFKKTVKDYPIDGAGRIVGEIHLNHVPVDFLKQDFQRSSPEWQRAMSFLRGDSSLQPTKPNADKNDSFIYKLYQGYRRVRTPGRTDMYMGYFDKESNKPERLSRSDEQEFYDKFLQRLPGYYDDAEWWKKVEEADNPPLEELIECPGCSAQNPKDYDMCIVCGHVLIEKTCLNPDCRREIPKSAQSCPHCGISQSPKMEEPWTCQVCGGRNRANDLHCNSCGEVKGRENPVSLEYMLANSNKSDELSYPGCSIQLADGSYSSPINVDVYVTTHAIIPAGKKEGIPLIAFKDQEIIIFVDRMHKVFKSFRVRAEQLIAAEVALYIYDVNRRLSVKQYQGEHTLTNIEWKILNARWANKLEDNSDKIREEIISFFVLIKERLTILLEGISVDVYNELTEEQIKNLVNNMLNNGVDISLIGEMKNNGQFIIYLDESAITDIFKKYSEVFFDGGIWDVSYSRSAELSGDVLIQAQLRIRSLYMNCLNDITDFIRFRIPEPGIALKTRLSLEYLQQKVSK